MSVSLKKFIKNVEIYLPDPDQEGSKNDIHTAIEVHEMIARVRTDFSLWFCSTITRDENVPESMRKRHRPSCSTSTSCRLPSSSNTFRKTTSCHNHTTPYPITISSTRQSNLAIHPQSSLRKKRIYKFSPYHSNLAILPNLRYGKQNMKFSCTYFRNNLNVSITFLNLCT